MPYQNDITIVIEDGTLPLAELEGFVSEYTNLFGATVTIINRWGGPAASGLEVEIAVAVLQLLKLYGTEAFDLAKVFLTEMYRRIGNSGARMYGEGRFALVVESEDHSTSLFLCFPAGLTEEQLGATWDSVEQNWGRLVEEWTGKSRRVDLRLDLATGQWEVIEDWRMEPDEAGETPSDTFQGILEDLNDPGLPR